MVSRTFAVLSFLAIAAFGQQAAADQMPDDEGLSLSMPRLSDTVKSPATTDDVAGEAVKELFEDEELQLLATDYHPTVDRWTERNNRIKLSLLAGGLVFSGDLDISPVGFGGLRISWEAPGFIGIHFDAALAPYVQLRVKPGGNVNDTNAEKKADGYVSHFYLSLAIFNPQLSTENLAFWAGAGAGVWYFDFDEDDVQDASPLQTDVSFQELVPAAKVFVELDYRITQTIHIGFGAAGHVLYAEFTDDGRFYDVNGQQGGVATGGAFTQDGRNDGAVGHLALVFDVHASLSFVF